MRHRSVASDISTDAKCSLVRENAGIYGWAERRPCPAPIPDLLRDVGPRLMSNCGLTIERGWLPSLVASRRANAEAVSFPECLFGESSQPGFACTACADALHV
jgi:hypothetical protein